MRILALLRILFFISVFTLLGIAETIAQKRAGFYNRKNIDGRVRISDIETGGMKAIRFDLLIGNPPPYLCVGELKGNARWISETTAEYNPSFTAKPDSCRLTFIFSGNQVIIRETNCDKYHGVSCNFEGTYIRSNRKRKRSR